MQNKPNDVWTVSDNPTGISAFADPTGNLVLLDENALEDVSGGCPLHIGAELVPEKMRLK